MEQIIDGITDKKCSVKCPKCHEDMNLMTQTYGLVLGHKGLLYCNNYECEGYDTSTDDLENLLNIK